MTRGSIGRQKSNAGQLSQKWGPILCAIAAQNRWPGKSGFFSAAGWQNMSHMVGGGELMPVPDVSISIVSLNTSDMLRACLNSLFQAAARVTFEVIVVDNGSQDGSREM